MASLCIDPSLQHEPLFSPSSEEWGWCCGIRKSKLLVPGVAILIVLRELVSWSSTSIVSRYQLRFSLLSFLTAHYMKTLSYFTKPMPSSFPDFGLGHHSKGWMPPGRQTSLNKGNSWDSFLFFLILYIFLLGMKHSDKNGCVSPFGEGKDNGYDDSSV